MLQYIHFYSIYYCIELSDLKSSSIVEIILKPIPVRENEGPFILVWWLLQLDGWRCLTGDELVSKWLAAFPRPRCRI